MRVVNNIHPSQGEGVESSWMRSMTFTRVKADRFIVPIIDPGGNGSKISSVLDDPLRFPPRAPRVQEKKPLILS